MFANDVNELYNSLDLEIAAQNKNAGHRDRRYLNAY